MAELISSSWGDRVDKVLDDFERNPRRAPRGSAPGPSWRPLLTGILLEDLPNEGQADVAVLQKVSDPFMQKIAIDGYPSQIGGSRPAFTLTYSGQTTTPIDYQATAAQVQAALGALSNIGPLNVSVSLGAQAPNKRTVIVNATGGTFTLSLGTQTTPPIPWNATPQVLLAAIIAGFAGAVEACVVTGPDGPGGSAAGSPWEITVLAPTTINLAGSSSVAGLSGNPAGLTGGAGTVTIGSLPGVWIVNFIGAFLLPKAAPPAALTATITTQAGGWWVVVQNATSWQDTGQVEVINAFIPVGSPTPMRAGAAVLGHWQPGTGYVLGACECREFPAVTGY